MSDKIQVFRVETVCGQGPYRRDDNSGIGGYLQYNPQAHPAPREDFSCGEKSFDAEIKILSENLGVTPSDFSFCFGSTRDFMSWFYDIADRARLSNQGYQISIYEVEAQYFLTSAKQAVFLKDKACFVKRVKIPD